MKVSLDKIMDQVDEDLTYLFRNSVRKLYDDIKQDTPVDTGTLRDGWEATINTKSAKIVNKVPYVGYVEYGTDKMAPVGMVARNLRKFNNILNANIRG